MEENDSNLGVFSLSMLDAILGGFGAMVIIVLLLARVLQAQSDKAAGLDAQLVTTRQQSAEQQTSLTKAEERIESLEKELKTAQQANRKRGEAGDREHREWYVGGEIYLTRTKPNGSSWQITHRCRQDSGWIGPGGGGTPATGGGFSGR